METNETTICLRPRLVRICIGAVCGVFATAIILPFIAVILSIPAALAGGVVWLVMGGEYLGTALACHFLFAAAALYWYLPGCPYRMWRMQGRPEALINADGAGFYSWFLSSLAVSAAVLYQWFHWLDW